MDKNYEVFFHYKIGKGTPKWVVGYGPPPLYCDGPVNTIELLASKNNSNTYTVASYISLLYKYNMFIV